MKTAICFLILGLASQAMADKKPNFNLRKQILEVENKIVDLNRKQQCETDGDCLAVAYGFKSCGGPASYLIVSKQNPNLKKLTELTDKYRKMKEEEAKEYDLISTCDITAEPTPRCLEKRCQAGQ